MKTQIDVRQFYNFDLEIAGWYAFGHHNPDEFLLSVTGQTLDSIWQLQDVKQGWASVKSSGFEFVTQPISGFEAVTVVDRAL